MRTATGTASLSGAGKPDVLCVCSYISQNYNVVQWSIQNCFATCRMYNATVVHAHVSI
jgi:hypothetical protein